MHGDNITLTLSRSEARLLLTTLGAAIQRFEGSVADDEALCEIQDTLADALEG